MAEGCRINGNGDEYWWATLDILAGREEKKPRKDIMVDVEEWLTKITAKIAKQRRLALQAKPGENEDAADQKKTPTKNVRIEVPPLTKGDLPPEYKYLETTFGDHIEIECCFNNPRIRSRLEKLMGSNVVRITDRKYMIKLQERIKEDHLENQKKRIQEREAEEVEREKKLILEGKISIEDAPKELKNHPVCKINQITKKILEDKKTKVKGQNKGGVRSMAKKTKEPERSKKDEESSDRAEVELGAEEEEKIEESAAEMCAPDADVADEVAKGFMFSKEEYEKLKYEAPLVKMLKEVENVEDMYKLAEQIVGPLKHQKTSKRRQRQDANGPPM